MTDAATSPNPSAAWAVGLATFDFDGKVLDTWYPEPILGSTEGALRLAEELGHTDGSGTYTLSRGQALDYLRVDVQHLTESDDLRRVRRSAVVTFIGDLQAPPVDTHDCYLRLHLLSHRLVKPHGCNLDGLFGLLTNVVWTSLGPCSPVDFENTRMRLQAKHPGVSIYGVDKFPKMTDYVLPDGVRIADASRVRLGAYLAPGTTVMHEGFVNFNAGALGVAMIEGRVSQGVVIGDGTDIGGGASIMGTLSGGGKERVSIGQRTLLGANAGLGISLGDDCIVESGLYVTAGTKVTVLGDLGIDLSGAQLDSEQRPVIAARALSGIHNVLFRRNSISGAVEVVPGRNRVVELNTALHAQ